MKRPLAVALLCVSLLLALYTGYQLKQALGAEHELREAMAELSLATTADTNAPAGAVTLGESSLKRELAEVKVSAHHDELYLALECVGLLAGVLLLRRRPAAA